MFAQSPTNILPFPAALADSLRAKLFALPALVEAATAEVAPSDEPKGLTEDQIAHVKSVVSKYDRNELIKALRDALKQRTGKSWSVTGGRGTAYGWITIDAPPARRNRKSRLKAGATTHNPEDYEYYEDPSIRDGYITQADEELLERTLGMDSVHRQGVSIPADSTYQREYLARALYGTAGPFKGEQYWD